MIQQSELFIICTDPYCSQWNWLKLCLLCGSMLWKCKLYISTDLKLIHASKYLQIMQNFNKCSMLWINKPSRLICSCTRSTKTGWTYLLKTNFKSSLSIVFGTHLKMRKINGENNLNVYFTKIESREYLFNCYFF